MSSAKEKPLSEGKKLHTSKNSKTTVAHGTVEIGVNRQSRDFTKATHAVSKTQDKVQNLRFRDTSKFRENVKNHTEIEKKNSQMRFLERPSGNKRKDSTIGGFGMVHNASFHNSKQGFSGKPVDKQRIHSSVKDVANLDISPAGNALASKVTPPAPNPDPVENWVCCDSCQKWRLLPYDTLPEHLPEKWLCSMLNWLPGKNRCDITEEETTKALNALYQVPLATGQNNMQNDTSRTTSGVNVQHVEHTLQSLNSLTGPTQAKKKHGLKEIAKAEVKRNPLGGGNTKQVKMKNKREADHYGYGNPKKIKIDLSEAALGRMGLKSKSGLSIKVHGTDILKPNDCSFPEDVKCDTKEKLLVSVKKLCNQSQISLGGGSLNVGTSDTRNISMKKRKLKESQDDGNGLDSSIGNDEDNSRSGLKKVKKLKILRSGVPIMNNSREKLDKKEVVAQILSSGSHDHAVDGVNAERHVHQLARGSQRERASDGHFAHAPGNDDVSKASICPGSCEKMNGVQTMLDAKSVSPGPASSQIATKILEEAKKLRDYADTLKESGFGFESNETNFQAARKFLHGASLLETSNEVGRQGEMTQIQAYSITAKLCKCSAVEYERRCEMASAALAYKCLEVAHWRIVYCKNSNLSRDRNELQACLQTSSQGESASSSASDIAGNSINVAGNYSNFLRLLDFTQDVNSAGEASRKSQDAYSAAKALEEAQNKDCIILVKKVIDFGFQDVEELLHLVQQATEAVTPAGLVNARE